MAHEPVRTCIGCRKSFRKGEVLRLVAGPHGVAIDYREKLPGRGAYVCPNPACIEAALKRDGVGRALRTKAPVPSTAEFIAAVDAAVVGRIASLIAMAAKAGRIAAGYSAVSDALRKGTAAALLFAEDLSDGTREKLLAGGIPEGVVQATLLTRDGMGRLFGRELVGVVAVLDRGFADTLEGELGRLKVLRNARG